MGNGEVKEYDDFVPRADLMVLIKDLEGRLYQVSDWLQQALDTLEAYADLQQTEDGDVPNEALATLSAIASEIYRAPFCVRTRRL